MGGSARFFQLQMIQPLGIEWKRSTLAYGRRWEKTKLVEMLGTPSLFVPVLDHKNKENHPTKFQNIDMALKMSGCGS